MLIYLYIKEPDYHSAAGHTYPLSVLHSGFDPGNGSGPGTTPCVSDLSCLGRLHSDRLAGLLTHIPPPGISRLTLSRSLFLFSISKKENFFKHLYHYRFHLNPMKTSQQVQPSRQTEGAAQRRQHDGAGGQSSLMSHISGHHVTADRRGRSQHHQNRHQFFLTKSQGYCHR